MIKRDIKVEMLEHSEAKVKLYGKYLSSYFNILGNVSFVEKIFLFDLLAGEGIYENEAKGSPIIALDVINKYIRSNKDTGKEIEIWFNDIGMSNIEPKISKIERVKNIVNSMEIPTIIDINYFQEDFKNILPKAIHSINSHQKAKGIFFIDPYGYKEIDPTNLIQILSSGNSEVILFLPISHMYRFAMKSLLSPSPGSFPLKKFLTVLFPDSVPSFSSVNDFIKQCGFKHLVQQDY